ncbi:MAG: hypothetical protein ACOZQL_16315 [Myxococcota bacterium]
MKRKLLGFFSVLGILAGFSSCANESVCGLLPDGGKGDPKYLTPEPQACADRESIGFGLEFNSGAYIGTKPQDTLVIRNGGIADLNVESVSLSGDSAFSLTTDPTTFPAVIKGNERLLMRVVFAPTQGKLYTGKITVTSNADNFPVKELALAGCGVPADGGYSSCYGDGGM